MDPVNRSNCLYQSLFSKSYNEMHGLSLLELNYGMLDT
jgi:hypothetical protein